jgi:hypothetical protein
MKPTVDKTIWNPRPVIDLVTRAVSVAAGSSRLFLGHRKQKYLPPRDLVGIEPYRAVHQ